MKGDSDNQQQCLVLLCPEFVSEERLAVCPNQHKIKNRQGTIEKANQDRFLRSLLKKCREMLPEKQGEEKEEHEEKENH
jgi:hypothetical protein